ncbi:hypothetical protein WMF15_43330 [Sorangium sp. So ce233]
MGLSAYIETLNLLGDESRIRLCVLLRELLMKKAVAYLTPFVEAEKAAMAAAGQDVKTQGKIVLGSRRATTTTTPSWPRRSPIAWPRRSPSTVAEVERWLGPNLNYDASN